MGKLLQNSLDKKVGQDLEQDSLDKSARTKKFRQDNQDKRAGTEQP
jgi:hypothetical protein